MKKNNLPTGRLGEQLAEKFLKKQGYRLVAKNYKTRYGEIDIIGYDGDVLVFIEVKARATSFFGLPEEAVNFTKQNKIIRVALYYLNQHHLTEATWRVDVVGVELFKDQEPIIRLIKNAITR